MECDQTGRNEADFDADDPAVLAEIQKTLMIRQWLDNMPSSPEPALSDLDQPHGRVSSRHQTPRCTSEVSLRDLIVGDEPLKFTHKPEPIKPFAERESVLSFADDKIPEINRLISSHPNYSPFFQVTGTAVWVRSVSKAGNKKTKKSWTVRRFFTWLRTLSVFRWFWKHPVDQREASDGNQLDMGTSYEPTDAEGIVELQPAVFAPFKYTRNPDGKVVPTRQLFGGDNIQDEVHSALNAISTKLNNLPDAPGIPSQQQMPSFGFSDGEAPYPPELYNQLESPSVQEIQRLTSLLQQSKKPSKMKSIFGIREFIRTDLHPSLEIIQQREPQNPSTLRRVLNRISTYFWNQSFRRPRRLRRISREQPFQPYIIPFHAPEDEEDDNLFVAPLAQPVVAEEDQNQNIPRRPMQNILRSVAGGFRGLMRFVGIRRQEGRVHPEVQIQEQQPYMVPFEPQIPEMPLPDLDVFIGGRHRRSRSNNDELRIIVPSRRPTRPPNPLRRRGHAEFPSTTESLNGDGVVVEPPSNTINEAQH